MVRLSRELLDKHPDLFESMLSGCKPVQFESVAKHLFQDEIINFGHMVTLYTYVGLLAKRCSKEEWLPYTLTSFGERRLPGCTSDPSDEHGYQGTH